MAGETVRDVVIRVSLKQTDTKLVPPDIAPIKQRLEELEKKSAVTAKTMADSQQVVTKAIAKTGQAQSKVADDQEKFAKQHVDASLRSAEGIKKIGEGAIVAGRGLAFLWAGSEDDMRVALQTIAKFQGAFDLFKGGTDVIKGTVETVRALRAATAAATVAQGVQATTQLAVASTAQGATVAVNGLTAAMLRNPVLLAMAGITLAVAAGAVAWRKYQAAADDALELTQIEADKAVIAVRGLAIATDKADAAWAGRIQQKEQEARAIQVTLRSYKDEKTQLAENAAEAEKLAAARRAIINDSSKHTTGEQLGIASKLADIESRQVDLKKQKLTHQAAQQAGEEKELRTLRDQLRATEDRIAAEEGRIRGAEEMVGRLSEPEFREFQGLLQKVQAGGQLSHDELQRVESFGGQVAQPFVQQRFQVRGQERNAIELLNPLAAAGGSGPLTGAGSKIEQARTDRSMLVAKGAPTSDAALEKALTQLQRASQEARQKEINLLELMLVNEQNAIRNIDSIRAKMVGFESFVENQHQINRDVHSNFISRR